jgi:predicted HTH domain antitoxin
MEITIDIPESVVQVIRLPEHRIEKEIRVKLALSLYQQRILSFGKARELASLGKYEFGKLLGDRDIIRHYGDEELQQDLAYANRH